LEGETQVGDTIELTVFRQGRTFTATVTLEERPDPEME